MEGSVCKPSPQAALDMVSLDDPVPENRQLRKIDAVIDFSLFNDRVAGLDCVDNGRPPLDPPRSSIDWLSGGASNGGS